MSLSLQTTTNPGAAFWGTPLVAFTAPAGTVIPVDLSYDVSLTLAVVGETNSVANPTFLGQRLILMVTAPDPVPVAASRVITFATTFDSLGETVLTFGPGAATLRQYVELVALNGPGGLVWQLVSNFGATPS